MAYFAELNAENEVVRVIAVSDEHAPGQLPESESLGITFLESLGLGSNWKQSSFSSSFRKNHAGIGYLFDPNRDAFISPSPFPSWILDEQTCRWISPVPRPDDGDSYVWDEDAQQWVKITSPE